MAWAGQVLARLDPTGYEIQVRSAEASWLTPNPATPSYCHSDNEKFCSNPNYPQGCRMSESLLYVLRNSSTSNLNTKIRREDRLVLPSEQSLFSRLGW